MNIIQQIEQAAYAYSCSHAVSPNAVNLGKIQLHQLRKWALESNLVSHFSSAQACLRGDSIGEVCGLKINAVDHSNFLTVEHLIMSKSVLSIDPVFPNLVLKWAEDRNIVDGSSPIKQAMKLFSESGELSDNIGSGQASVINPGQSLPVVADDIGDNMVVITIILGMCGIRFNPLYVQQFDDIERAFIINSDDTFKKRITTPEEMFLNYQIELSQFCLSAHLYKNAEEKGHTDDQITYKVRLTNYFKSCMVWLALIADHYNVNLNECLKFSYNEIKDRKGLLWNGVFIKESNPDYPEIYKAFLAKNEGK